MNHILQLNILQLLFADYQLCVKVGEEGGGWACLYILLGLRGKEGNNTYLGAWYSRLNNFLNICEYRWRALNVLP